MSGPPSISCIVATRNAASVLPRLLDSLARQTCRDFELVVQDGASTDNTVAIAREYAQVLPRLSLRSEPDTGIYDAWNKALSRIRGRWVLFLGADDCLLDRDSLEQCLNFLGERLPTILFVASPIRLMANGKDSGVVWHPSTTPERDFPQGMPFPHPGLFYRAVVFSETKFDTNLAIAGDYDLLARQYRPGAVAWYENPIVGMALGGVSSDLATLWKSDLECLRVSRKRFPSAFPWKPCLRLARSLFCAGLVAVLGSEKGGRLARRFADLVRRVQGKPPLWNEK